MHVLSACPICQGQRLKPYLSCEDHTVSHETFTLEECERCGFVMTNPRPTEKDLPAYYKSDAYISHSNKPANLTDRVYKFSRYFTLKWKLHLVKRYSVAGPDSILDFGCGTGDFLARCKKHGLQTFGVEPSRVARQKAAQQTNATIWEDASGTDQEFDVITLWHVLEHVPLFHQTLDQLRDLLATDGTMFIAVPNLKSLDSQQYGQYWAAYDVPRHLWHFSRETMRKILSQHQLTLVKTVPMKLDAYYVSLLSEKYMQQRPGIRNMAKALIHGWQSNRKARTTGQYSSLIYIVRK